MSDRKIQRVSILCLCALLGVAGCGSDDKSSPGGSSSGTAGGSCITKDACYEVSTPKDWDVKSECDLVKGAWAADACKPAQYKRKCTQETSVSINDGPEQSVVYVYYFPAGSQTGCLGEEETL